MNKNKNFTVKNINGVDTLHQNNAPVHCPFRNPFFMPPTIQGAPPQISIPACNAQCLFFNQLSPVELSLNCTDTFLTLQTNEQT